MNQHIDPNSLLSTKSLRFLWIELTNKCNLECIHCYANSSPYAIDNAPLSDDQYTKILSDAAANGCTAVQFIGGEPTLHKSLPKLLKTSHSLGFSFIEVYSNLISMSDDLLETLVDTNAQVATSVYSDDAIKHDQITKRTGSFERTICNIKTLLGRDIPVRASFIAMESNADDYDLTKNLLSEIGIENVGYDQAREFGRANPEKSCKMGELCGECSKGTLCIDPDGGVSPCIMSKAWGVGDLNGASLTDILSSERLQDVRRAIHDSTIGKREIEMGGCNPSNSNPCGPDSGSCSPCSPNGHCGPNACAPK